MHNILTSEKLFKQHKIIPIITLNDINKAVLVANALKDGGIMAMEITLRTPNALQIIKILTQKIPEITVGAGTVLTEYQYHLAVNHGAQFIVSPGLTNNLITVSREYNLPFLPGAITPTEMLNAYDNGFNFLKYFPAESYNGLNNLKSLVNVLPKIKFCPTGGINLSNAQDYLALPNVIAIGCSFLVNETYINNNDFTTITNLTKKIIAITQHN